MTISRRGFIGGLAAGASALTGTAHARSGKQFTGYADSYGLLHDSTLCVGCRECEVGCKKVNDLPPPETPLEDTSVFDTKRRTTVTDFTVVNRYKEGEGNTPPVYAKHQCMHCNEPCCVSVCFVQALTKTPEGPVVFDPDLCVGCRYCLMACPYDALAYEYDEPVTPRVMGCTMCHPLLEQGKLPGCAESCPMDAITFGKREDLIKLARERIRKYPQRYIDHIYGEYEFGGTSWLVLSGIPFGELGLHENAPHAPIQEMGSRFLSMVPLVAILVPGMLAGLHAFSERKDRIAKEEREAAVDEALKKAKDAAEKGGSE